MIGKTVFSLWPVGIALLAGAGLPFQAASNAAAGRALGHPFWGALVSLVVSLVVVVGALGALQGSAPPLAGARQGPWWLWIGGVLGAVYVAAAAAVTPKLGAGGFLACVIAGQMLTAMAVDHAGLMGVAPRPVDVVRVGGVVLILCGVLLVQYAGMRTR